MSDFAARLMARIEALEAERNTLRSQLAEAELRFAWFADAIEDATICGVDPADYLIDENTTWAEAWRQAINAKLKISAREMNDDPL